MFEFLSAPLAALQRRWRSPSVRNWRNLCAGVMALAIVLGSMQVPGLALGVKFSPISPRLGETLVLNLTGSSPSLPPIVKVGSKTYPAFGVGGDRFRAMIPTTPLEKPGVREIEISVPNDPKATTTLKIAIADRKFPTQRINFTPGKAGIEATPQELKQVTAFKATVSPIKLWDGKFIAPNQGRTSSPFGVRRYYNGEFATDYYHRGLDYAGGYGSAVVAPAGGKVVLVGYEKKGFRVHGNIVGVDHGQGVVSIFMHLSKIDVEAGQMLAAGDRLGAIGSTGSSTGPHLHWGLYVNAVSVDPVQWRSTVIE
ncbi:M23 family metallopeptidase [Chamaesiphon sp. OTE_75_metabat_556]|uniref:M23 family metallopeptidase n=1 Tax=Chamaesiphon sp. OTE_75_metabat_556 TaxID=2964692 RepID=UPI00286C9245|nr:M23 family metallopeptidase [Chamaesiphon sp. OTE_75_metabat_556]